MDRGDWWATLHRVTNNWTQQKQLSMHARKTTRPFRYDLNQIPYDYTVEVMNRFMGINLVECLKNYGQSFITLYRSQ